MKQLGVNATVVLVKKRQGLQEKREALRDYMKSGKAAPKDLQARRKELLDVVARCN